MISVTIIPKAMISDNLISDKKSFSFPPFFPTSPSPSPFIILHINTDTAPMDDSNKYINTWVYKVPLQLDIPPENFHTLLIFPLDILPNSLFYHRKDDIEISSPFPFFSAFQFSPKPSYSLPLFPYGWG